MNQNRLSVSHESADPQPDPVSKSAGEEGRSITGMPVILLLEDGDEWLNPDIRNRNDNCLC
jgi:hypothetical protein